MIILHFGTNNTGIHTIPVCVTWYDTENKHGAYYVIKPSDYWEHNKVNTGCKPTYEDCMKYGLPTSFVAKKLNENLSDLIVYTQNPISTRDCLDQIYDSCAANPTFTIENLHDFIPDSNFSEYTKACSTLRNNIECNNSFGYVLALSGVVKLFSNVNIDNSPD